MCRFVSSLGEAGLKYRTLKSYLSAIRYLHIHGNFPDPFVTPLNRLQYVLRGIRRVEAEKGSQTRQRLPISPSILRTIRPLLNGDTPADGIMLWAACCLGFFGFLRAGEFTIPSDSAYDPSSHLSMSDVSVNNPSTPTVIQITIKQSKTDPFRKGVSIFLGKTGVDLCPVSALLSYLIIRGKQPGPLFRFQDGRFLTRQRLVEALRKALRLAGIDESKYSGHSFRSGAATTAATKGFEDNIIKTLGRWSSLAYLDYIKIPRSRLADFSRLLVS